MQSNFTAQESASPLFAAGIIFRSLRFFDGTKSLMVQRSLYVTNRIDPSPNTQMLILTKNLNGSRTIIVVILKSLYANCMVSFVLTKDTPVIPALCIVCIVGLVIPVTLPLLRRKESLNHTTLLLS